MAVNKTNVNPKEGKIILSKGTREPGGHLFEIYIDNAVFFASIVHAHYPEVRETFEINSRKYSVLESAVDARIAELKWDLI